MHSLVCLGRIVWHGQANPSNWTALLICNKVTYSCLGVLPNATSSFNLPGDQLHCAPYSITLVSDVTTP